MIPNPKSQNDRYSRQILFDGIGYAGQDRLLGTRVLIIGCGALGSAQAESLARAGVGRLRIADRDFVEFSNLQRQTMFTESDAADRLRRSRGAGERSAETPDRANGELASFADAVRCLAKRMAAHRSG